MADETKLPPNDDDNTPDDPFEDFINKDLGLDGMPTPDPTKPQDKGKDNNRSRMGSFFPPTKKPNDEKRGNLFNVDDEDDEEDDDTTLGSSPFSRPSPFGSRPNPFGGNRPFGGGAGSPSGSGTPPPNRPFGSSSSSGSGKSSFGSGGTGNENRPPNRPLFGGGTGSSSGSGNVPPRFGGFGSSSSGTPPPSRPSSSGDNRPFGGLSGRFILPRSTPPSQPSAEKLEQWLSYFVIAGIIAITLVTLLTIDNLRLQIAVRDGQVLELRHRVEQLEAQLILDAKKETQE